MLSIVLLSWFGTCMDEVKGGESSPDKVESPEENLCDDGLLDWHACGRDTVGYVRWDTVSSYLSRIDT
jgi:hypothetical protein